MTTDPLEILLVEDNPTDAELTIRALQRHNLANHIRVITDGAEALGLLLPDPPDSEPLPRLILLDLKLPRVNGLEVLQRVKASDRTRRIPVIVLTSSQHESDLVESYRLGVNSYVVKPVNSDEFTVAVAELGLYWLILNKVPSA